MRKVTIREIDHESLWLLEVDGVVVGETRNDDMDLRSCSLDPLWEALGVNLLFESRNEDPT